jgi:putative ABC transport system permease protein
VVGSLLIESISRWLAGSDTKGGFFARPEVEFSTALIALAVLIVAGLLASLMPAAKAAAVNPIVALQDE